MKKIIYGALVTLTAISLIACSDNKKSDKNTEKESSVDLVDVNEAENQDEDIEEDSENDIDTDYDFYAEYEDYIEIDELKGKTYSDVIEAGYSYEGYMGSDGDCVIVLSHQEIPEEIKEKVNQFEGMTVNEFIKLPTYWGTNFYDRGNEYCFYTNIGAVEFNFEIEDSYEIVSEYDEDPFVSLEDMEKLCDSKIKNVTIDTVQYILILDDEAGKIVASKGEGFEVEMLNECKVVKCCYQPIE